MEFALVAVPTMVMLFAILYFGLLMTYRGLAEHGARNAARFGSIRLVGSANYPTNSQIETRDTPVIGNPSVVATRMAGAGVSALPCLPTAGGGRKCGDGDVLTVTATYDAGALGAFTGLLPGFPDEVTRTATARFE